MANQIATNSYIFNKFGLGPGGSQAPTKSVIEGYGLTVSGSYTETQLVKEEDITAGLVNIPLYVIVHSTEYAWDYDMPIRVEESDKYASHFNIIASANGCYVTMNNGSNYNTYINTSLNNSGVFQKFSMSFSYEQEYYISNTFNSFVIPANGVIKSIYLPNIYFYTYAGSLPLGDRNPTSDASYALSLMYKVNGLWQHLECYMKSSYGVNISSCMLGDYGNVTLDTGSNISSYNLSATNLQGIAICIDRWGYLN